MKTWSSFAFLALFLSNAAAADSTGEIVKLIDRRIEAGWTEMKLQPSPVCTDREFIRRASLDLIGRIATPDEIERFFKDPRTTRRATLINRLLASEGHARHWAALWTSWLLPVNSPFGRGEYAEQMEGWITGQLARNVSSSELATNLITAAGKSSENPAVLFVLANLGRPIPPAQHRSEGMFDAMPLTSRTSRVFLGFDLRCVQCHDHPFAADLRQEHFWSFTSFFRQITVEGKPATRGKVAVFAVGDSERIGTQPLLFEKPNGLVLAAPNRFLDRRKPRQGAVRRAELARFIVESPRFSKALVNRVWGQLFGRGIVQPVDDLLEYQAPSHPELLDELAREFQKHRYDSKALLRWICNSKAYQLSSTANRTNDRPEHEPFFSRMILSPLSARQLFDSVAIATGATETLRDTLPSERRKWLEQLIVAVENDEDNEIHFTHSIEQAHLLMNGSLLDRAITAAGGTVQTVAKQNRLALTPTIAALYLHALNRRPTAGEVQKMTMDLKVQFAEKDAFAPWYDLFWALLNSNEFALRH